MDLIERPVGARPGEEQIRCPAFPVGRLIGICLVSCGIAMQLLVIARGAGSGHGDLPGLVHLVSALLSLAVYLLMAGAYLLRREGAATDPSGLARCIAVGATFTPFLMPLWPTRPLSVRVDLISAVILAVGMAGCVWSLRHLWTSFSVIPQARSLVSSGPYRWVRHPLYTTEIIANAGMAIHYGRAYHWAVLVLLIAGQSYRARREERLLSANLPGYGEYRARTAALVPGFR